MPSLYLTEQGAKLSQKGQRLMISKDNLQIADIPLIKLESVLIYGNIQISTQAMKHLLLSGVETSFFNMSGKLLGQLIPPKSKNNILRIRQFTLARDTDFSLGIAKELVSAKIKNSVVVLKRYLKNYSDEHISDVVKRLKGWHRNIENKVSLKRLLGAEGNGTQLYYNGYKNTFRGDIKFQGRNRRPPRDEANALMSFSYVLLINEMTSMLNGMGFDPYVGFYHQIQYGRPALALDLIEPFRPAADAFVSRIVNLEILSKDDFEERDGGVFLIKGGLKNFFKQYEKWTQHEDEKHLSIRNSMRRQIENLRSTISTGKPFETFTLK